MKNIIINYCAFVVLVLAASGNAWAEDDEWNFTVLFPMVWATDIDGEINIDDRVIKVEIPFSDITDSLNFGYMAEFYAQKGRWMYAVKLNYMESEREFITDEFKLPGTPIPIAPSHRINTDLISGTTDLMVGYQVRDSVRLYSGVRIIFSEIDLDITPLGTGVIEIEERINLVDETLYDWLVGADYTYKISPRWSMILNGDIAIAGDNDTDYVANAALTYRISKLNNLWMGYRYMRIKDTIAEDGTDIKTDFIQHGPMIGWAFTF